MHRQWAGGAGGAEADEPRLHAEAGRHGRRPLCRACVDKRGLARLSLYGIMMLVAPLSLHGEGAALRSPAVYSPSELLASGCRVAASSRLLLAHAKNAMALAEGTTGWAGSLAAAAASQLHLRGGKGNVKAGRSKSVSRTKSPERSASVKKAPLKKKRKQKQHNLGPADWMKKIKRPELQRRELSMKGSSKGRKKPVFHFWTKSKIKKFTEKRVAFRTKRRERKERLQNQIEGDNKAEVIHCWSRGWKTKFVKWLPSAAEQRVLDEAAAKEAAEAAKKALEEKEAAGGGDDEDGGGGEGDGGDGDGGEEGGEEAKGSAPKTAAAEEEEEDFMMGGFGGDSEGSGLF